MTEERPYFELVYLKEKAKEKLETFPYISTEPKELGIRMFIDGYHECQKEHEWFDAKESIPLPKKAKIYRYTLEVISDEGDIVCYDYKDKCWKKIVIEDEKVTYVPIEIKMWCNKPTKEDE